MVAGINKIDDEWLREQAAISERMNKEHLRAFDRSFYGHLAKLADDERERDDAGQANVAHVPQHVGSTVADLLVEAGSFPHRAAALQHLLLKPSGQALLSRLSKKEPTPMKDTIHSIMKDCGPVAFAKTICDTGRSYGVSEQEYVEAASRLASELYGMPGDRAFAKLCEGEGNVVMRACGVLKAAEFSVFDIKPVAVVGPGAMHAAIDDEQSAVLRATKEIQRIGREKFPFLPADQQFARVFEDKNYAALAAQAHRRPGPTTIES